MNIPPIPTELLEQTINGNCIAFIGAGLSQGSGLPNWEQLLNKMLVWGKKYGVDIEDETEIQDLINKKDYLTIAEELKERFGNDYFRNFFNEIFLDVNLKPNVNHTILLKVPFTAYITTNYDTLLETSYVVTNSKQPQVFNHSNIPALANAPSNSSFYIFKMHGTIEDIRTIILGRTSYREIMFKNAACREYLKNIFSHKTILFLGFGLGDPHLTLILDSLQAIYEGFSKKHFALMDNAVISNIQRKRFEKDYNIRVLPYSNVSKTHQEVTQFLENLFQEIDVSGKVIADKNKENYQSLIEDSINWAKVTVENIKQLNSPIIIDAAINSTKNIFEENPRDNFKIIESMDNVLSFIDKYNSFCGIGAAALRQRFTGEKEVIEHLGNLIKDLKEAINEHK